MNEVKIGSLVKVNDHPYDKDIVCQVDRIYMRGKGGGHPYCRVVYFYKGNYRMYNTPITHCEIDISEFRNKIIEEILNGK